ncbi:endonuclease domain-containing protein [uncultured Corynebacterium sp.]|uniref:endonuclease domain-containing protein n=1 Tax=uncultured Corynebacterium sp. TaxID=159447 RepID=UPI002598DCA2|nr:hypothetical protein [uncultured Corynebacterium sp.]
MGIDREHPGGAARLRELQNHLRDGLVAAGSSTATYCATDRWSFPIEQWVELPDHNKQLLQVIAAAKGTFGAVLVGRSAARIHGMWLAPLCGIGGETVEISLRGGGSSPTRRSAPGLTFRHARLRDGDVGEVNGFVVTSAIRTFADIARYHGLVEGIVAADWLRYRGLDMQRLQEEIAEMGRLKGIATVRQSAAASIATSESAPESLARGLLIQAGIGPVDAQVPIGAYRVDLLIDGWLIIEIDGAVKYSGPDSERVRQSEFNRQKRITNQGFVFLRYAPSFLIRYPERFISEVRETLAARRRVRRG